MSNSLRQKGNVYREEIRSEGDKNAQGILGLVVC
jgi:hypothetical protein